MQVAAEHLRKPQGLVEKLATATKRSAIATLRTNKDVLQLKQVKSAKLVSTFKPLSIWYLNPIKVLALLSFGNVIDTMFFLAELDCFLQTMYK